MSEATSDSEKQFRHAVYPALKARYGEHFETLVSLCSGGNELIHPDDYVDFLFEFYGTISGYKSQIDDPDYFQRMAECQEDFSKAASLLSGALTKLEKLGGPHWLSVSASLPVIIPAKLLEDLSPCDMMDLLLLLKKASLLSASFSAALILVGGRDIEDVQKRRQGNARLPYRDTTIKLLMFWQKWTGGEAQYAKAAAEDVQGGRLVQKSTEFVRLALSFLDPTVTAANAVTSVNNARVHLRELRECLADLPDGTESIQEYLRSELQSAPGLSKSNRPENGD